MGRTFQDFNKICYEARIPAIKTVYTRLTSDLHSSSCPGARKTGARSTHVFAINPDLSSVQNTRKNQYYTSDHEPCADFL